MKNTAPHISDYARELRRNMTKEERHLWYDFLKSLPQTFHRQKPIGSYIVDFCCLEAKLIIELDGSQHYEETGSEYDRRRDHWLNEQGYRVIRYSNADINDRFSAVCEDILNRIKPSPGGEGGTAEAVTDEGKG